MRGAKAIPLRAILQEKYCATDAEENYPQLDQAFSDCKLVGTKKDPELWFNDLDHLNMRLARINLKYEKDDLQMKSHMMTAMSKEYDSVIVKFRGDLSDTPLEKLRKEVVFQFKALVKDGSGLGSESVLSASNTFKGTCRNCGKTGHKAHECRSDKVKFTDGATKGASTSDGDKSNVTCYNCQGKGHFANECSSAKNLKSDPSADIGMFVGASCVDGTGNDYGADVGDSFFDNMSDSVAFGEEEDTMFGHLIPASGSGGHTKNDTGTARIEDIEAETETFSIEVELVEEHASKCDLDVLATDMNTPIMAINVTSDEKDNAMNAFVVPAVTLGRAEERLIDYGGTTDGVAYDNKHTTDLTDSNREVTIGHGGKFETLGDDATMLKALPDDNAPLDVPDFVTIAEDVPVTMAVTGVAPLDTGVAPMESFSKILKSLGLIQCKTDPCLFVLFDKYGNLQAIVVVCCNDCIITGREKWITRLKIGISGKMTMSNLGELKRHLGVEYKYGYDEHIRCGENTSDTMTKNLSLVLFAKHATLMSEGMLEYLYHDPQNTEDVKIYCATVEVSSVTAPCGQYSNYDSILSVCSGDHDSGVASDVGWATTHSKSGNGKVKGTLNLWKNKEPVKKVIFDGID